MVDIVINVEQLDLLGSKRDGEGGQLICPQTTSS
jgi:hypothetical protein